MSEYTQATALRVAAAFLDAHPDLPRPSISGCDQLVLSWRALTPTDLAALQAVSDDWRDIGYPGQAGAHRVAKVGPIELTYSTTTLVAVS